MSSEPLVIEVHGLSKIYQIYDTPSDRLKQAIYPRLQRLLGHPPASHYREFQALHDITFNVGRGETLGIVGRNGAGKSTLLQIIAGTLSPTRGHVRVAGRVAALLELGSGFNPEFTGRENVFLNAAILGFDRNETEARYDEILAFADIGDFINQPVKTYSSGMVVRLAFAVSVCVAPDILIVDEALAVGDASFQFKCLQRLERMQVRGTTLLFVSHDISLVQNFCRRAIYLEGGRIKDIGTPEVIAAHYAFDTREMQRQAMGREHAFRQQRPLGTFPQSAAFGDGLGSIIRAVFSGSQCAQEHLECGQAIDIETSLDLPADSVDHYLAVVVQNARLLELAGQRFPLPDLPQGGRMHYRIRLDNPYCAGDYFITLRLMHGGGNDPAMPRQSQIAALHFQSVQRGGGFPFIGLCNVPAHICPDTNRDFRIVALLTVRNEARYLERCLAHLVGQGIGVCVIDNDSTDDTASIARRWLGRGVVAVEHHPYPGHFDLEGVLRFEEDLAMRLDADWFIHHDADEIRQSRRVGETLAAAIRRLDLEGCNAIDFDEFVFVPDRNALQAEDRDYVAALRRAYCFAPRPQHRVNAWKKTACRPDLVAHGGHQVFFPGRQIAPERLVLRHYPFLDVPHLVEKYTRERIYSDHEVNTLGWHGKRAAFRASDIRWPSEEYLIDPERDGWDTSRPLRAHPFLGEDSP